MVCCLHAWFAVVMAGAVVPGPQESAPLPAWSLAHAEHLWNRAGFGAPTATLERALAIGLERQVDELMRVQEPRAGPDCVRRRGDLLELLASLPEEERERAERDPQAYVRSLPSEALERRIDELRAEDGEQANAFLDAWVARMLSGEEPLRERMTLFWHGFFTSSMEAVQSSFEMIHQNELFRRHALGSFRELLHAVVHDPAMLVYLDNASSRKRHPNENFARELMELFTLGEGCFTEEDVRAVARAFTGWSQHHGLFFFDAARHDDGEKVVLGVTGNLDGDDVVEILLRQEACSLHLAHALLEHFEGLEPAPERLRAYAAGLRGSDYRIDSLLRRLFLDPEFYRDEVRASRIASPFDYLVGSARRIGGAPEPRLVVLGATLLGQRLFFPPSVRGWSDGQDLVPGSGLLLRGELVGVLLGRTSGRELLEALRTSTPFDEEAEVASSGMRQGRRSRRNVGDVDLRPLERIEVGAELHLARRLHVDGACTDAECARALLAELLPVPVPEELAERVEARLARARAEHGLGLRPWCDVPDLAEPLLRELAQGILAQPEAQLD